MVKLSDALCRYSTVEIVKLLKKYNITMHFVKKSQILKSNLYKRSADAALFATSARICPIIDVLLFQQVVDTLDIVEGIVKVECQFGGLA